MTGRVNRRKFKVGDLGWVVTGKTPSTASPENFGRDYPFLTPTDMHGRKWARSTERGLSKTGASTLRGQVPAGAVAISCIGWQMGKAILTDRPTYTNQQINTIIPNQGFDAEYLYYYFATRRDELLSIGSAGGVRTPIISKSSFEALHVEVPDLRVQRNVASILSAYDDLIENNTRRIAVLEEMARRIYEEWFVRFRFPGHEGARMVESELGLVPEGWRVRLLGDEIELAYGKALKAEDRALGNVPVYGSSGVVGHHSAPLVVGPGIIVGRKGNVGSVHWCDVPFFPIDTVFYVNTALPLHYVFFNLQRQNFLNNDAAVPGLNRNQAYALPLLVPSRDVLGRFDAESAQLLGLARLLARKTVNLRATRDLLLPKLISGELDVSAMSEPEALAA